MPPQAEDRDPLMKTPTPCLLLATSLLAALAVVACDRRDLQPRQESQTTDTVIVDPAVTDPTAVLDPLPPPATSPCAGMSGQAEADCRARERARRAGDMPPPGDTPASDPEDIRR